MELRPRFRVTIEREDSVKQHKSTRLVLLRSHLRSKADDAPHVCQLCLRGMVWDKMNASFPLWSQCPACCEVYHEKCWIKLLDPTKESFACPNCKATFDTDEASLLLWDSAELCERLREEEDEDWKQ